MTPAQANSSKIVSLEALRARRKSARADGRTVVQCHGCFDIVHPGHVRHLQHAARQGDILLVSITADSVMRKGDGRPLFPQELRAENLAALDCVDWVCVNDEETAVGLLGDVQPDVYIKGREYESNSDPRFEAERDVVERHGGRVVFSSGDIVFSSTALIHAMETQDDTITGRLAHLLEAESIDAAKLEKLVDGFAVAHVCVLGETIIDTYVHCDRPDVASESPVISLRPLERQSYDGGAAIVARHLAAMGAKVTLITALARSVEAEALRGRLEAEGVQVRSIECSGAMLEKQRFLVGSQKVMKLDLVERLTIDAACRKELVGLASDVAAGCDAAILADFGQGFFTPKTITELTRVIRPKVSLLAGDVSGSRNSMLRMRGLDLICPTEHELRHATNNFEDSLNAVVWRFLERTGTHSAFVTLGGEGLIAFDRLPGSEGERAEWRSRVRGEHVPALVSHPIDTLGCGDALLAAATLAMLGGGSTAASALIGAVSASVEAMRLGNEAVHEIELRRGLRRLLQTKLVAIPERGAPLAAV